jgi:hypothetical protein
MIMTIKKNNEFFWSKNQKNLSYILYLVLIISIVGLFIFFFNPKQQLKIKSIKTTTGWGYQITNHNKIIIKQSIIPVISQSKSFRTEKEALDVGQLVLKKLNTNNSPTITRNDLILLKIKI